METVNIKERISLLLFMLAGILMYSCSSEETVPVSDSHGQQTTLSILLNNSNEGGLKSSGNPELDAEKKIYSLEVLIFKSDGGERDGYGNVIREIVTVTGQAYDKEYKEIDEIKGVGLTAGKRDIYVIANAPDKYFEDADTYQKFLKKYERLSTQGRYPHLGSIPNPDDDLPIGGINPSNLKTNLTMCGLMKNVQFNNLYDQHYLGYTENNGRPSGVTTGFPLNGTNKFYVERLVARVAIKKIEFGFPAEGLLFESGYNKVTDYTYQIDSVFMMNAKTTSKIEAGSQLEFKEEFGHGCDLGYSFLNKPSYINNLYPQSKYTDFLVEAITTPNYDIIVNATPLWFYTFENTDSQYPTYLVIGVRYNFKSLKDGVLKTVKSYYPVEVNRPDANKLADHDYIKRNYQYQITARIKGLGSMYGNNPVLLKSQTNDQDIEISETVGQNLFPWTGDTYR